MTQRATILPLNTRDVDFHVRHLLRHLNDGAALRKNALVQGLFSTERTRARRNDREVLARIKMMVLTVSRGIAEDGALGSRARRWHEIIVRCDIGGELHKLVADEFGIGMRQFYRERRLARAHLAAELQREIGRASTVTEVRPDAFELVFASLAAMRNLGQTSLAAARAQSVLQSTESREQRIVAGAFAAEVLCDENQHASAQGLIDEMRAELSRMEHGDSRFFEYELRVDAAQARLLWDAGTLQRARVLGQKIHEEIERRRNAGGVAFREFAIDTLSRIAWRDLSAGEYGDGERSVALALSILESLSEPSSHARAMTLTSSGTFRNIRADERAAAQFVEALEICRRNGLSEDAVAALMALSVCQQLRGALDEALQTALSIAAKAEELCTPVTSGLYYLRLAELQTCAGNAAAAAVYARRASKSVRGVQFAHMVAELIDAEAHLAQGAFALALESASAADDLAAKQVNHRMRGTAQRVIAEALHGLGKTGEAREVIASSVSLLERAGHPFSLHRAYASSSSISGHRTHARYARQIECEVLRKS